MSIFDKIFKWDLEQFIKAVLGVFLFCFALNVFIVPANLYNGGVLGISQLIRTFLVEAFDLKVNFDIAGILNFVINIPLFILAYKSVSKTFFFRTLFCVSIQTIFLTFIPTPDVPMVSDMLTTVLIAGIIVGIGSGMTLSAGGSGGGTDIIGVTASLKNKNFSVGKLNTYINLVIYIICGIKFSFLIMIYSIIYSVFANFMLDRTHLQNISSTAMVFTKDEPSKIAEFVKKKLDRDLTTWEAVGGYKNTKTYISYIVLSNYELDILQRNLFNLDKNAFLVKTNGVQIDGNFRKKL